MPWKCLSELLISSGPEVWITVTFDNLPSDIGIIYGLPYHTKIRWLSQGAMLKHFINLQKEIEHFMEKKSKSVLEFQSLE